MKGIKYSLLHEVFKRTMGIHFLMMKIGKSIYIYNGNREVSMFPNTSFSVEKM